MCRRGQSRGASHVCGAAAWRSQYNRCRSMFETLGQYKILDALGAGGMGQMFRARDTRSGRTVAIKVIDPEIAANPARRPLFMADAQAAVSLSHPNIALLYEV